MLKASFACEWLISVLRNKFRNFSFHVPRSTHARQKPHSIPMDSAFQNMERLEHTEPMKLPIIFLVKIIKPSPVLSTLESRWFGLKKLDDSSSDGREGPRPRGSYQWDSTGPLRAAGSPFIVTQYRLLLTIPHVGCGGWLKIQLVTDKGSHCDSIDP